MKMKTYGKTDYVSLNEFRRFLSAKDETQLVYAISPQFAWDSRDENRDELCRELRELRKMAYACNPNIALVQRVLPNREFEYIAMKHINRGE